MAIKKLFLQEEKLNIKEISKNKTKNIYFNHASIR